MKKTICYLLLLSILLTNITFLPEYNNVDISVQDCDQPPDQKSLS